MFYLEEHTLFNQSQYSLQVARSGHTVVRASSALILFGGEDAKRRKLNDLHMFDLKSLTWLPLHCTWVLLSTMYQFLPNYFVKPFPNNILLFYNFTPFFSSIKFRSKDINWVPRCTMHVCRGPVPSPRYNHVAALYDDKMLLIFGGASKSKTLNDLYSLDFETVGWAFIFSCITGFCGQFSLLWWCKTTS